MDIKLRSASTWMQIAGVLAAAWLMMAPAVLDLSGAARNNDYLVGPVAVTIAFIAIWEIVRGLRLVNVPLGAWLIAAPWVLQYDSTAAIVSDTAAGAALVVTALLASNTESRFGGGWSMLLRPNEEALRHRPEKP